MIKQVLASVMILSSFSSASLGCAGECIEDADVYLKELQGITDISPRSAADRSAVVSRLFCLYNDARFTMASQYPETFASQSALEEIKTANQKSRELCFKLIPRFLKSKSLEVRCAATAVLAYYGWPRAYELLMRCEYSRSDVKATLYAIVGDRRAVPWIIEQYKRADARFRERPDFILHCKMAYLNALYHLASPAQLPFVESIIRNPRTEGVRKRAEEVRDHITELYPELRRSAYRDKEAALDSVY
jgi:hypothetical protein